MLCEYKVHKKQTNQRYGKRTSTARGEIPIISVSPSSPVLGFCTTLAAGRTGEVEKVATGCCNEDLFKELGAANL